MEDRYTDGVKMPGNLQEKRLRSWAVIIWGPSICFWVLPMKKIRPAARS